MRAFLLLCIQAVAGFTGRGAPALASKRAASRAQHVITMGGRAATPLGRVSTKEGKLIKINLLKEALDGSTLIFNLPSVGLTPKVMSELRRKMPDDAQIIVAKNTLMKRAMAEVDGYGDVAEPLLKRENAWVFCGDDVKGAFNGFNDWVKESAPSGKEVAIEYKVLGGVSAGQLVDAKGVEQISKLPTKVELIAKIAALIQEAGAQGLARKLKNAKGMPQGIAKRMKKAAGQKLVVAVKMGPGSEEKNMS